MRTDKSTAISLRSQGKSYNEIIAELGMSKSTLTSWFKGISFSEDIKKALTERNILKGTSHLRSLNKDRGDILAAQYMQAEREATQELQRQINNPMFIAAVVAYWGEGDKSSGGLVRLANTDPKMIKLFLEFLVHFCGVPTEKIRGALYTYPDLDEEVCLRFWKNETGLRYFHKTQVLPSKHKTKRLPYGTCTVLVANKFLKRKILLWIDQLPEIVLNTVSK